MKDTLKFMENITGPVDIPMLIRAHRTGHDLTQTQMAMKLNVSTGYISNIETGKTPLSFGKTIEICKKLKENEKFWMTIYFETEARKAGEIIKVEVTQKRKRA